MSSNKEISVEAVKECLSKSGYLLPSRMIRSLSGARFFVEPNVAFKSARTGTTKFIGLVAEDGDGPATDGVCVKTAIPIETYNNDLPLVLLAERPSTPNADWENYIKFGVTPMPCPFYQEFHIYDEKNAN